MLTNEEREAWAACIRIADRMAASAPVEVQAPRREIPLFSFYRRKKRRRKK